MFMLAFRSWFQKFIIIHFTVHTFCHFVNVKRLYFSVLKSVIVRFVLASLTTEAKLPKRHILISMNLFVFSSYLDIDI